MKKITSVLLVLVMVLGCFAVSAYAAGEAPTVNGFYGVGTKTSVTITMLKEDDTKVIPVDYTGYTGFYGDAVKMTVEYSAAVDGKQYLVLLTEGDELPTADDAIFYIDQTAGASGATFSVYPAEISKSCDLTLWITSNDGNAAISIPMKYYVSYMLGDANLDGIIGPDDALAVLQAVANMPGKALVGNAFMAADVDEDGILSPTDALWILQAVANMRTL